MKPFGLGRFQNYQDHTSLTHFWYICRFLFRCLKTCFHNVIFLKSSVTKCPKALQVTSKISIFHILQDSFTPAKKSNCTSLLLHSVVSDFQDRKNYSVHRQSSFGYCANFFLLMNNFLKTCHKGSKSLQIYSFYGRKMRRIYFPAKSIFVLKETFHTFVVVFLLFVCNCIKFELNRDLSGILHFSWFLCILILTDQP